MKEGGPNPGARSATDGSRLVLNIAELSAVTGVKIATIRYCEQQGHQCAFGMQGDREFKGRMMLVR
ncbi:hypothetical protein [Nitratireductor soli]|uniref:hypothetical protein n=1 Tax=Nitratireductor soli TaxID=1670619 RepID=UPI0012F8D1B3|nr:hypothetical protein [Nitratireductor soli]